MKDVVYCYQGATDTQPVLKQMETMLSKFKEQLCSTSRVIAAPAQLRVFEALIRNWTNCPIKLNKFKNNCKKCKLVMLWLLMISAKGKRTLFNPTIARDSKIPRLISDNGR